MAYQVLCYAYVVPRVGLLEVHEAGLKNEIEPRDDADRKRKQAERGDNNPLPSVQDGPER
jgi:hypothetical protein